MHVWPSRRADQLAAQLVRSSVGELVLTDVIVNGDLEVPAFSVKRIRLTNVHVVGNLTICRQDLVQLRLDQLSVSGRLEIAECEVSERALVHLPVPAKESTGRAAGTRWGAQEVSIERTSFAKGGTFRLATESVSLKRSVFTGPTMMLGDSPYSPSQAEAEDEAQEAKAKKKDEGVKPALTDLAAASVGDVTFDGFDLRRCRFRGALNLDSARFATSCDWLKSPGRRKRRMVFDEFLSRAHILAIADDASTAERWVKDDDWKLDFLSSNPRRRLLPPRSFRWLTLPGKDGASNASAWRDAAKRHLEDDDAERDPEQPDRRTRLFHPWEVEGVYQALARGARSQGLLPVAADHLEGAHRMRLLTGKHLSVSANESLLPPRGDLAGRNFVRAFWLFGGLGARTWVPATWLAILVLGFGAFLTQAGFVQGGAYCEAPQTQKGTSNTQSNDRLCDLDLLSPRSAGRLLQASSVSFGLVTSVNRPDPDDFTGAARTAVPFVRLAGLLLIGLVGLTIRNRVAGG